MRVEAKSRSFHEDSIDAIAEQLRTDLDSGLTAEEVAHRYETYGHNELPVKPGKPAWLRFLLQFHQPLLYILLLAGAVKAFLGSWTNAAVILGRHSNQRHHRLCAGS